MKTMFAAVLATLLLAGSPWSTSAGQDFQDSVRMGLVFYPSGSDSDRGVMPGSGR
jgi:hypothetical protein